MQIKEDFLLELEVENTLVQIFMNRMEEQDIVMQIN